MSLKTNNPSLSSGTYTINIAGNEKVVYCDMVTDGGGWTLVGRGVQQRLFGWNSTREAINQNISPSEYSPETFKLSDLDINSIEKAVFKYKYLEALKLAHPNIKDRKGLKAQIPVRNSTLPVLMASHHQFFYGESVEYVLNKKVDQAERCDPIKLH